MSNTAAARFDRLATSMQRPFWETSKYLYTPPGAVRSRTNTIAHKCIGVIGSLFALALAILGIVPRFIGIRLQKELFYSYTSEASEKTPSNPISILSWNISAMHGCIPTVLDNLLPWKDRMDRLLGLIKDKSPDIIALQEVVDEDCSFALIEGLEDEYTYFYHTMGQRAVGYNSGLFVASKIKITQPKFTLYKAGLEGDQYFINKGYFTVSVGEHFDLIVTHLYPRENPKIREAQWKEIEKPTDKDWVIAGDFNLSKTSDEYQMIKDYDYSGDEATRGSEIIDYILSTKTTAPSPSIIEAKGLSDHHALLAEIPLSGV